MTLNEVAPPTKKHERMVKHIKKAYKKDGKLTDDEKSIAYATAWKNYNSESAVLDANKKITDKAKKDKIKKELARLLKHASDKKADINRESFEIDKSAHKAASKKSKMRNLAKDNTNPHEKAAAEKKAGGPKLYGEDSEMPFVDKKDRGAIRKRAKNLFKKDVKGEHHGVNEEISRRNKPSAIKKKKTLEKLLINKEVDKVQKEETTMTYQEMIDAGWEMTGEGIWWPPQETETVTEKLSFSMFRKKSKKKKKEATMDKTTQKLHDLRREKFKTDKQKEHEKYVNFMPHDAHHD
jgi:hypothetical protein